MALHFELGIKSLVTISATWIKKAPEKHFKLSKMSQNYLDEYVFRFNRRKSKSVGKKFMRLVQQVVKSAKITYSEIMWDMDPISEYYLT